MTDKSILSAKELTLISHKLRTPLSIINGYSEAVLSQADKENFSPFTSKALEEINKQGNRMSILVDKLMAFNQVFATNEAQVEKQPIELKNLIKSCAPRAIDRAGETTPIKKANGTKYGTFVEIDCNCAYFFRCKDSSFDVIASSIDTVFTVKYTRVCH
jgi:K+-sensing histidine kinase KdpD